MHLTYNEEQSIEITMFSFYAQWHQTLLYKIDRKFTLRIIASILLLNILLYITFIWNIALGGLGILMLTVLQGMYIYECKKWKDLEINRLFLSKGKITKWINQIKTLGVTSEEKECFLKLISVLNISGDEYKKAFSDVMRSPVLSQTRFVQHLSQANK